MLDTNEEKAIVLYEVRSFILFIIFKKYLV